MNSRTPAGNVERDLPLPNSLENVILTLEIAGYLGNLG
jgi:hypothetical protein